MNQFPLSCDKSRKHFLEAALKSPRTGQRSRTGSGSKWQQARLMLKRLAWMLQVVAFLGSVHHKSGATKKLQHFPLIISEKLCVSAAVVVDTRFTAA